MQVNRHGQEAHAPRPDVGSIRHGPVDAAPMVAVKAVPQGSATSALAGAPPQGASARGTHTARNLPPESHLSTFPCDGSRFRHGMTSGVDAACTVATQPGKDRPDMAAARRAVSHDMTKPQVGRSNSVDTTTTTQPATLATQLPVAPTRRHDCRGRTR